MAGWHKKEEFLKVNSLIFIINLCVFYGHKEKQK